MTPDPLTPSPDSLTPRFEIERALDFADSGESTGGVTTHWSLKTLARAFRQLERENAALVKERSELKCQVKEYKDLYEALHRMYSTLVDRERTGDPRFQR